MSTPPASPEMKQQARELLASVYEETDGLAGIGEWLRTNPATCNTAYGVALRAIERALSTRSTPVERAKDDWRCINCKHVVTAELEPKRCPECRGVLFAHCARSTPSIDWVEGLIERGWKFGGNNSANDEDRPGAWMTSPKGGTVSQYMLRRAISELGQVGPLKHTAWLMDQFSSLIGALASLPTIGRGVK